MFIESSLSHHYEPYHQSEALCKKISFLNETEISTLKHFFNHQERQNYFRETVNNRWGIRKNEELSPWTLIAFDGNGKVIQPVQFACHGHLKNVATITSIVVKVLEQLAKEMSWIKQSHLFALTFMQHQLFGSDEIPGIEFHRDNSEHSLVIMLDNCQDPISGWDGGDFLFRLNQNENLICQLTPEKGCGILFSNEGTQHAVTPFKLKDPSQEWIQRTILTIHQRPEVFS